MIKVKPNEKQNFKTFEIDIPEIGWKDRVALNNRMIEAENSDGSPMFDFWGDIVMDYCKITEEEINKYSTDEIIAIANMIFDVANKKK